jgi:hypothetical protein
VSVLLNLLFPIDVQIDVAKRGVFDRKRAR